MRCTRRTIRRIERLVALTGLLLPAAGVGCSFEQPSGEAGALGRAYFSSTLESELGRTPIARGSRFLLDASSDGCDSLEDSCPAEGRLLVRSSDDSVLNVEQRADGDLGALAQAAGSVLLQAVDGDGQVVDFLAVEVAVPSAIGWTDQPADARAPTALPLDWTITQQNARDVDLRRVMIDRDDRVLLSAGTDLDIELEIRDPGAEQGVFTFNQPLGGQFRLLLNEVSLQDGRRWVVQPGNRSLGATVYRTTIHEEGEGAQGLSIEVRDVRGTPSLGVVEADLCAVRTVDGAYALGHGFVWTTPASFVVVDLGLGAFPGTSPAGSRCVRVRRYESREVDETELFSVSYEGGGAADGGVAFELPLLPEPDVDFANLPFSALEARVQRLKSPADQTNELIGSWREQANALVTPAAP